MKKIWNTICGYIWWTYDRGSFHYDVMVTLILLFIFISPHYIPYKDKPTMSTPHPTGVLVNSDGQDGLIYQVEASAVGEASGSDLEAALLRVIEPISGEVKVMDYKAITDSKGKIVLYRVRARR